MAGFFGLFDYNKEGPGVDKNGPKKKGFVIFFEIYFRKFWKLICANLLYVIISLPLLTVGLAQTGLGYITRNFAREKHAFIYSDFMDTIKKNWKQALPYGILNVVFQAILFYDIVAFWGGISSENAGFFQFVPLAIILMIFIIFSFMKFYIPMLIITFKLSFKQVFKNSLIFAFAGFKRNFLIGIILTLCYVGAGFIVLMNFYIGLTVVLFLYLFLFPAFRSYLIQYNIFPVVKKLMIDPYYKEHPGEDLEAKRALNLEDLDAREEEEAPVFQDMGRREKEDTQEENNTSKRVLPKQYSEQDMKRGRRLYKKGTMADDDDDTI